MKRDQSANYIVFAALMLSTVLGFQSLWGLLFLYWVIPNMVNGQAFLLTEVSRASSPVLFWCIQVAWVVLGLMMIAADFFPALA